MQPNFWILIASALGATAVMAGAFGAHALKTKLGAAELIIFETAAKYQMYHALALLALGVIAQKIQNTAINISGWLFIIGTAIFSGSLYILVLSGQKWLGAITPIGGACLIFAWFALFVAAYTA